MSMNNNAEIYYGFLIPKRVAEDVVKKYNEENKLPINVYTLDEISDDVKVIGTDDRYISSIEQQIIDGKLCTIQGMRIFYEPVYFVDNRFVCFVDLKKQSSLFKAAYNDVNECIDELKDNEIYHYLPDYYKDSVADYLVQLNLVVCR